MRIPLRFLVFALVLAEIAGFVLVGQAVGVLGTLALIVLSSMAGVLLLRRQGLAALTRMRGDMQAGRAPAGGLGEAALLALAAVLMIVPGFITSAAGALLFVPPLRRRLLGRLGPFARRGSVEPGRFRPARAELELQAGDYRATTPAETPWRPPEAGGGR